MKNTTEEVEVEFVIKAKGAILSSRETIDDDMDKMYGEIERVLLKIGLVADIRDDEVTFNGKPDGRI